VLQTAGGIAAARNLGLKYADGEFVHFLDARDVLLPDAIDQLVRVFTSACDARACYSATLSDDDALTADHALVENDALDVSELARTDPVLASVCVQQFRACGVLIPRWFLLQIGEFEADLGPAADLRCLFRMARAGLKPVALPEPRSHRAGGGSPSKLQRIDALCLRIEADLRSAQELAREPSSYRYLVPLLARITTNLEHADASGLAEEDLDSFFDRVLAFESEVGLGFPSAEGLAAILVDQLLFSVRQRRRRIPRPTSAIARWLDIRQMQLMRRSGDVHHVAAVDLRRWLPTLPPQPFDQLNAVEQSALLFGLNQLQTSTLVGELPIQLRSLVRLGSCFPGHPYESQWNGIARLARVLGNETAKYLCRQSFFYYGWQFLGQAKRLLTPQQSAA
jgi:hypothetical protein